MLGARVDLAQEAARSRFSRRSVAPAAVAGARAIPVPPPRRPIARRSASWAASAASRDTDPVALESGEAAARRCRLAMLALQAIV